jgi:hypothetical protein
MTNHRLPKLVAALVCVALLLPAAGHAAGRTKTIRAYAKTVAMTLTHADGTVVAHPPFPTVAPGDVLDVYALDFRGNHKRHAKRNFGSEHLRCVFGDVRAPDCISHVAIGNSLLVWSGDPITLIGGTGRFEGATGRVLKNKEVPGGNDVVAKVKLARHH